MSEEIGEILVQADELQHRIKKIAENIAADYAGKDLLLIGVLKGAFIFLADLMRHLDTSYEVDFMAVASYGSSTDSIANSAPAGTFMPTRINPRESSRLNAACRASGVDTSAPSQFDPSLVRNSGSRPCATTSGSSI